MRKEWFVVGSIVKIKKSAGKWPGKWKIVRALSYTTDCGERFWGEVCPLDGGPHLTVKQEDIFPAPEENVVSITS